MDKIQITVDGITNVGTYNGDYWEFKYSDDTDAFWMSKVDEGWEYAYEDFLEDVKFVPMSGFPDFYKVKEVAEWISATYPG